MGVYLSKPIKDKLSTDTENDRLMCGACSMQGWRVAQEDAHNCCLDFDSDCSLFAVYDGHGGHDVAEYTSSNLPNYIKNNEHYKKKDYGKALIESFLGFDELLKTDEVIAELKKIAASRQRAKSPNDSGEMDDDSDEGMDIVEKLKEEADMPITDVMAQYAGLAKTPVLRRLANDKNKPVSPFLKAKLSKSKMSDDIEVTSSKDDKQHEHLVNGLKDVSERNGDIQEGECTSSSHKTEEDVHSSSQNGEVEDSMKAKEDESSEAKGDDSAEAKGEKSAETEGEMSAEAKGEKSAETKGEKSTEAKGEKSVETKGEKSAETKGENSTEDKGEKSTEAKGNDSTEEKCSSSTSQQEVSDDSNEGKTAGVGSSSCPVVAGSSGAGERVAKRKATASMYHHFETSDTSEDSDSENDESFQITENPSSDEDENGNEDNEEEAADGTEDAQGEDGDEEGEAEEEEDEDEEEDSEYEDIDESFDLKELDEPGKESGCTAVVALVLKDEIYVANAGDSRAVLCRNGEAVDMSLDHKPEDGPEMERIIAAGGRVTADGRVNGGLNLSRALGDHTYKQERSLGPTEQMIIALPDIKKEKIDPSEDEFLVLACDGIWNSLTSQEVVDFIRPLIAKGEKLSSICEKLFERCLAPDTLGDGTGCDNMTCIIIRFLGGDNNKDVSSDSHNGEKKKKRSESPSDSTDGVNVKKTKLDSDV